MHVICEDYLQAYTPSVPRFHRITIVLPLAKSCEILSLKSVLPNETQASLGPFPPVFVSNYDIVTLLTYYAVIVSR